MTTKTTRSRARQPKPKLPSPEVLAQLKLSPEVAWYLVTRGIPLPQPWQVPLHKTPEPGELSDEYRFDPARVDKLLRAFGLLRHTQGRWGGRPLKPDPWQVAYYLAPVFGWLRFDDEASAWVRVVRTALMDISRKNGKTTLAGGVAIYLTGADGELGAQVIAVAASKDQAGYCFNPVKALVEKSPRLRLSLRAFAKKIVHGQSGSYFAVASSVGDLLHGANVHGAVIDELHVHKTRDTVDAVETGTGARSQPLVVIITTPDDGKPGTIYAEKRDYLERLVRRVFTDASFYGVVFAAAESEADLYATGIDVFGEAAWKRANPGYGISPTRAFLEAEAKKARESPANLARYLRLHLGIRTKQTTRYIRLQDWDATEGPVLDEALLYGKECHGGVDLASVSDLTALCWVFPDRAEDVYRAVWRFWVPEDAVRNLNRRTAGHIGAWIRQGWVTTTPGNVFDPQAVLDQIDEDAQQFQVVTIGYDRWGANDVTRKAAENGLTMVGVGQGFASLSSPLKEILRLVNSGKLLHGGNPVMRWMIDNLAVSMDPAGNVKPDKAKAAEKIDGVSALTTAMKECMDAPVGGNAPASAPASPPPERGANPWRNTQRLPI